MGGKILEYEAKTIMNEGRTEGWRKGLAEGERKGLAEGERKGLAEGERKGLAEGQRKGLAEGQILVFTNMIKRGFSMEDAMSLAEITKEQAEKAIADMKKQR